MDERLSILDRVVKESLFEKVMCELRPEKQELARDRAEGIKSAKSLLWW